MTLNLFNKAFEPSVSYPDKITYMTALYHTQGIHSDNGSGTAEKIQDLLSSTNSRLVGMQLLEAALRQNPDIYLKGRWIIVLTDILKGAGSAVLKDQACRLFCLMIPCIVKDPTFKEKYQFGEHLLLLVLNGIKNDCEWFQAACEVVVACTKYFPQVVGKSNLIQGTLNEVISKLISQSVSNEILQLIAEIYCELPNCVPNVDPVIYEEEWLRLYMKLFHSMKTVIDSFMAHVTEEDSYALNDEEYIGSSDMFENDEPAADTYQQLTRDVRRYVNLCTCMAKMLSYKTKFPVTVPVRITIKGLIRIFQSQEIAKVRPTSIELQVFLSSVSLIQNAGLLVLEALLLNFNLSSYSLVVMQLLYATLQTSKLPTISSEIVYQLRLGVYVFLNKWIARLGNIGCDDIFRGFIFGELLQDIGLDDGKSSQASSKSKKGIFSNCIKCNPVQRKVCKAALKALQNLVYCGVNLMTKQALQDLFSKVSQIACTLLTCSESYQIPYDDDSCRKNLYSLLLAIAVNSKPNHREPIQHSPGIFKMALRDPSLKVTRLCHKALAILRLCLHPKKPPVKLIDTGKQRQASVIPRFPQWSTEDHEANLRIESVSNTPPESTNCRITRTFHNRSESAHEDDDPMGDDVEESHYSEQAYSEYSEPYMAKYPEQVSSSQRNGEDILEVMNSSECQMDDLESEEEEEDEEEEEEERSYGEEDINEEDIPTEIVRVPSTNKLQDTIPSHIKQEAVPVDLEDQEHEPIEQCAKSESSIECKNKQLNGVRNLVPEEGAPSTSRLASENGIENSDEDGDDDDDEEEEDEIEDIESFPAEKRPPEFYAASPASKKPKLENDEEKDKPSDEHRSMSPPLQAMKDSFCLDIKDGTKS